MDHSSSSLRDNIAHHLHYSIAKTPDKATDYDWFCAVAYSIRDLLVQRWIDTTQKVYQRDAKRVYYLSMEFLLGRALTNSLLSLDIYKPCRAALQALQAPVGVIEALAELEPDPALGNGGLGRLAACFLDSMATLNLPGYGYGIRYEYGMFFQKFQNGHQQEQPDNWLRHDNPWEFPRLEVMFPIHFGGQVVEYRDEQGRHGYDWRDTDHVMAMAYDLPVPGYGTETVNHLRLWSAKSSQDFCLEDFNQGHYLEAISHKAFSETLSKVLYPSDQHKHGRELRLKQEYFFVSASIQDIVERYMRHHDDIHGLPDKVAVQLNDTHPALAIPELLRILLDTHQLDWDAAWAIVQKVFAYTNHTLLPEALETWSVSLFERLLPRHLQLIYEINHRFLKQMSHQCPGDIELLSRISIIGETGEKHVRMGHLAVVGSHKVNGVAALHTELMKDTIFADFYQFFPERFVNKTNGITPRRWLNEANPQLSALITQYLHNTHWKADLQLLKQLEAFAQDSDFQHAFQAVKQANKNRLAEFIHSKLDIQINPLALFDVQIKRIHEYKRQLLNVLHVITLYNYICDQSQQAANVPPRVVIFAGKAAPGYAMAKLIVKLINDVAEVVNNDPRVKDRLKVVFIPNYDVSNALRIIPAADLSEQISTAGTEASGTGNMKLALNGALTIGTLDGANVEIRDEVGADNIFIFGLKADEVQRLKQQGYNPWDYYHSNAELKRVVDMISSGYFSPDEPQRFHPIINALTQHGDHYLLFADYTAYVACQRRVEALFQNSTKWTEKAIINVANMGRFSSDRTVREYAEDIWKITV